MNIDSVEDVAEDVLSEWTGRRFFMYELIDEVYIRKDFDRFEYDRDPEVNRAIKEGVRFKVNAFLDRKSKNGDGTYYRVYYHSVDRIESPDGRKRRVWFHRDDSTPDEEERFGRYLIEKGNVLIDVGRLCINRAKRRRNNPTN
jgi:hypothetical protein